MNQIPVITVNYLNTKPFLEGLHRSEIIKDLDIQIAHPADCAEQLIAKKASIGLVPVAALQDIPNYEIITDYCLGCNGAVSSVCIYSNRPLESCRGLWLDYQSRSSVSMVRYLQETFWNYDIRLMESTVGYESKIGDDMAGLVIGDRCFQLHDKYEYCLDLGAEWKKYTGLPFVFAMWISIVPLTSSFKAKFNQALSDGVSNLQWSATQGSTAYTYLDQYIDYKLDSDKMEAFHLFTQQALPL